jgi:ribosomal protein L3 glutamine methyltransferase
MNVEQRIDKVSRALDGAGLYFGHGTDNAADEAAWLVLHAIGAPIDGSYEHWNHELTAAEERRISDLLGERISRRLPLAYLTGTTRFAGLEFETSEAALVPRSPLAELVLEQFSPWVQPEKVTHVLDLCTGSGCIAIAIAAYMPWAEVVAADISTAALAVARRNLQRHALEGRVSLVESDLFQSIPAYRYDLIVTNPPYVPGEVMSKLPDEYRAEPELGLVSGEDGLDACLAILRESADYLSPAGILICEVGESAPALEQLLPKAPFVWLEFAAGGSGVFVLTRDELVQARPSVEAILEKRLHVT